MANCNNLSDIIDRIVSKSQTDDDIDQLRGCLNVVNHDQLSLQLGKFNVNIGDGQEIHIGDRIQGLSIEDIHSLVELLKPPLSSNAQPNISEILIEEEQLERLALNTDLIESVNLKLAALAAFNEDQSLDLPDKQKQKFTTLKSRIKALRTLNQDLENIDKIAENLLKDSVNILLSKLQELKGLQNQNLTKTTSESCVEEQLKLLSKFKSQLDQAKSLANWLDSKRESLAITIGQYALDCYPEFKETFSQQQIKDFSFSIEQFIERLSHCLKWGRYNVLDMPSTPIVIDDQFYETAFNYLKTVIPNHLPANGIKQLEDYIDYLLKNLSSYQHQSSTKVECVDKKQKNTTTSTYSNPK